MLAENVSETTEAREDVVFVLVKKRKVTRPGRRRLSQAGGNPTRPSSESLNELIEDTLAHLSTFPRSHFLILGPNPIQSHLPVTPISQAEALLESHRIEDGILLADQQRKKVQGKLVADPNEVCLSFSLVCHYLIFNSSR